ncbi:defensin-like protein [Triticum aestivum]|nr:defensin-like protein [Aegilops tauschii subsp. strangulata]XP_044353882.1 defensin-like protein [Triticum aestivum]
MQVYNKPPPSCTSSYHTVHLEGLNLSYNPLSLQIRNFMDLSMKVFVVVLLLLVATEDQGPVQVALARDCKSQSYKFKGMCVRDDNCASVCLTEGFPRGKCKGFACSCHKDC